MHITPPLLSSLGKEDTVNRIKSNQCMSGTLHKPYVCVAGIISPNHLLISMSLIFIFNRNNPHHLPECTWAFSMQTTLGPLQDEEEWSCITQIIRHTGNVFVEAKQGGGGMHRSGQSTVLGSVWASRSTGSLSLSVCSYYRDSSE